MSDWDMAQVQADFFEVAPENWIGRDLDPLHRLRQSGRPVYLHGVSLNLGGTSPINADFLRQVRTLMESLGSDFYSDHLSSSGDAHQLYDLFPVPFTRPEAQRVADRIKQAQDILDRRMAIENATWYTNIGDLPEPDFLASVAELSDCQILLDLNNVDVNYKNHRQVSMQQFLQALDFSRVTYLHVAGHEYDERFDLYVDTHSRPVVDTIRAKALELHAQYRVPILLEWDNDVPDMRTINQELSCLTSSTT